MLIIKYADINELKNIPMLDLRVSNNLQRDKLIKKSIKKRQCLVAKIDNRTVGYLIFNDEFFHNHFIDLLVVDQLFRRQGVGSALIKFYEKIINAGKIFASTNKSNTIMQKMLKKLKFIKSGIIKNLDKGDPEVIYFKNLKGENRYGCNFH